MFKKTDPNPQLDIFSAPSMQLESRASKKYSAPNAWHNQFYSLVTTKIDDIGSNIARQSRYELIHTTLVKFLKICTFSNLSPEQEERAKEYLKEDSSKTAYR